MMPVIIIVGSILVTFALISYSIGIIKEQRQKILSKFSLGFISAGLLLDITSTACMIAGSTNSPFTLHGIIGYMGLLAMLVETILAWRFYLKYKSHKMVQQNLHIYTRIAYLFWVGVYITGIILVTIK